MKASDHKLHECWKKMRHRCLNPHNSVEFLYVVDGYEAAIRMGGPHGRD